MDTLKAYIETHRDSIVDTFAKTFFTDDLSSEKKLQIIDWTYKEARKTNFDYYRPQEWLPESLWPAFGKMRHMLPYDSPYTFGVPKLIREKGHVLLTPNEKAHWKKCEEERRHAQEYEAWKRRKAKEEAELIASAEVSPEKALDDIFDAKDTKRFIWPMIATIGTWAAWLFFVLAFSIHAATIIAPSAATLAIYIWARFTKKKEQEKIAHIKRFLLTPQETLNARYEREEKIKLAKQGKGDTAFIELPDGRICTIKGRKSGYYILG